MQKQRLYVMSKIVTMSLFVIFTVVYCSGALDISIKNATPIIVLPLLTAFAVFSSAQKSALTGLLVGICIDSVMINSYCFNALFFTLAGLLISLFSDYLFNKNVLATTVIAFLSSCAYFLIYWLIFHAFSSGIRDGVFYLLSYAFPSAVYTAVFIFPFYYLFKFFNKLQTQ